MSQCYWVTSTSGSLCNPSEISFYYTILFFFFKTLNYLLVVNYILIDRGVVLRACLSSESHPVVRRHDAASFHSYTLELLGTLPRKAGRAQGRRATAVLQPEPHFRAQMAGFWAADGTRSLRAAGSTSRALHVKSTLGDRLDVEFGRKCSKCLILP